MFRATKTQPTKKKINMPNRIHILDETLINKIAAGEVIENAASVVKELIENAIDAKASSIEVITKGGGRLLIQLSDNGSGIEKEDLPLALYRHATSKIDKFDDLFKLNSFGFRGEALASIASVAKIEITSSTGSFGHKIVCEGGKIIEEGVQPRKKGSTIEVRDLFFNLPVRKKFQKSLNSEVREIEKVLMQTALAYPQVHLKWIDDGKEEFNLLPTRDLLETIDTFFGKEWSQNLIFISSKKEGLSLSGYIGKPHFTRGNKMGQYLFVNNRPILSPIVSEAVFEGYATRINASRYPHFVLFLTVAPENIDVNVHPQKKEIRFHDEKAVFLCVRDAIEKCLESRFEPIIKAEKIEPITTPFTLTSIPLRTAAPLPIKKVDFSLVAIIEEFFLVEKEKQYFLVSSLSAQKRILFEKIKSKKNASMQALLFPLTIELSRAKKQALENNMELFAALNISIRSLGNDVFIIDALPEGIDEEKIQSLLEEGELDKKDLEKKVKISLNHLCKKKKFSFEEGFKLVETLFLCETPHLCPEGRPTFIPWPKEEIKRLFL